MKKLFILVCAIVLVLSSSFLLGCGREETFETIKADDLNLDIDKNINKTLTVGIMNEAGEIEAIEKLEEGFQKIYPNVKFVNEKLTQYEQDIMQSVAGGMNFDIIWAADQYVTLFADDDLLQDLDPFIEKSNFDTTKYYESMIKLGQYKHNGAQYFLPRSIDKIVTYINKSFFTKYNVEIPKDGWTWTDFLNTCKALYDNGCNDKVDKKFAVEIDFDWIILNYAMCESYGGTIIDPVTNEPVMDENFQNACKALHELIEKGYSYYQPGVQQGFVSGRFAMKFQVRPYAMTYYAGLKDDLEVVSFPRVISGVEGTEPCCGAGTTGYGIYKRSENKELSWKFLEYMMSEEGQDKLTEAGGAVPSLIELAEKEGTKWKTVLPINSNAFVYNGTKDVIYDLFDNLDSVLFSGYNGAIANMYSTYYSKPTADIATLVNTCKRNIKTYIRNNS